jgi:hypothetical protein
MGNKSYDESREGSLELEKILEEAKSAPIKLEPGQAALYIGSGSIGRIEDIALLVDTATYILSDRECFSKDETLKVGNKTIVTTSKDGFEVLKENPIGFVLIDQAVVYSPEQWNLIRNGAYVVNHSITGDRAEFLNKRIGLVRAGKSIYQKIRDVNPEDFEVANSLEYAIGNMSSLNVEDGQEFNVYGEIYDPEEPKQFYDKLSNLWPKLNAEEKSIVRSQLEDASKELASKPGKTRAEINSYFKRALKSLK